MRARAVRIGVARARVPAFSYLSRAIARPVLADAAGDPRYITSQLENGSFVWQVAEDDGESADEDSDAESSSVARAPAGAVAAVAAGLGSAGAVAAVATGRGSSGAASKDAWVWSPEHKGTAIALMASKSTYATAKGAGGSGGCARGGP